MDDNTAINLDDNDPQNQQKKENRLVTSLPAVIVGIIGLVILVCLGIGILLGRLSSLKKTIAVFEPDYSRISDVSRADLEETARILNQRCDRLGCASATFIVNDDNQIVGKMPVFMGFDESLAGDISAVGLIEFVDFGDTAMQDGAVVRTDFGPTDIPQDGAKVWHTIMTNAEIATAMAVKDMIGSYVAVFTLSEQGAQIFSEYTSKNVGTYLGIVLDKVVISSPQINSPILGGEAQISGNFSVQTAGALAAYLGFAPLPIPIVSVEDSSNNP